MKRLDGGATLVRVWTQSADGTRAGEPFYRRTFDQGETSEVQVYLRRRERPGRDPRAAPRHHGAGDRRLGRGRRGRHRGRWHPVQRRRPRRAAVRAGLAPRPAASTRPPPPPENAPWIPPRDWGRDTFFVPWLSYGSDIGPLVGGGIDTRGFGFRKDPYASRHVVRAAWAFGESTYRADYRAEFRSENRGWYSAGTPTRPASRPPASSGSATKPATAETPAPISSRRSRSSTPSPRWWPFHSRAVSRSSWARP